MTASTTVCRACGSPDVLESGPLPPFNSGLFGGQPADLPRDSGRLFSCTNCHLQFRDPCLTGAQLLKLYEKLPDSVWADSEPREYWPKILGIMTRFASNRTVLDVGCYRGDFLSWLPAEWKRLGIEPSRKAAIYASNQGVKILGPTIEDSVITGTKPGVITAFDVIEHVVNPLRCLTAIRDCLAPGGCIVIISGATDSWPFKIFGRHYWYCSLPEHVTFCNLKWFHWAASELGMHVAWHSYLSSEPKNRALWFRQAVAISIYALVNFLKRRGIPERLIGFLRYGRTALGWRSVPWWKQSKDHILIVLAKNTSRADVAVP